MSGNWDSNADHVVDRKDAHCIHWYHEDEPCCQCGNDASEGDDDYVEVCPYTAGEKMWADE